MAETMRETFDTPTTNGYVPTEVTLTKLDISTPRFTPRELQMVKDRLGRSFSQVIAEEETDDKFSVIAWLKLRRDGYPVDWDQMLDIVIAIDVTDALNPTSASPQTT